MNYTIHNNLILVSRNEGKIKTYESCSDLRAWSHDLSAKNHYLREWIKCDMPICAIPVSTLTGIFRTMTCRSRGRVAPRCHQDCKSKMLLDSISTSCRAMRECLKQDDNFEKYFVEEELETSQWPCERCLDALKSIKMFWKIIVDKIFQNITKSKEFETDCNSGDDGIGLRSVAKAWQNEMVQQARYVKNVKPALNKAHLLRSSSPETESKLESSQRTIKSCPVEDKCYSKRIGRTRPHAIKADDIRNNARKISKKHSKGTQVKLKMLDTYCDTCFLEKELEEIMAHKRNIQVLQDKCNKHNEEVERLKNENNSLKIELENVYKSCPWKVSFSCPSHGSHPVFPKPFENSSEEPNNIDSEMIITMKKCKNENFRHVALLQVIHKTNEPRIDDSRNEPCCNNEDPIEILTKVQKTFGAIVKREISIANDKRHPKTKKSDIEATFHRVNTSRSAPSCSTVSSSRLSYELFFASDKQNSDKM